MEELNGLLSIEACNCERPNCSFFGGGIGEYGRSYSRDELKYLLKEINAAPKEIKKIQLHLRKLLRKGH